MLDHLPSRLLQRVVDERVEIGWIAKSTYFLIPQWESRILKGPPRQYVPSGSGWDDGPCDTVLSASARLSCSQPSIGSLTGFSIPCYLLCCYWRRSGHGLVRCQWNGLLRSFQIIHVLHTIVLRLRLSEPFALIAIRSPTRSSILMLGHPLVYRVAERQGVEECPRTRA